MLDVTETYIDFEKTNQGKLVRTAIQNSKLTWTTFAETIGICRSAIYFYRHNKVRMPKSKVELIVAKGFLPASVLTTAMFKQIKYTATGKPIMEPTLCEDLAYFLGVEFGDGCIPRSGKAVIITSNNTLENNYSNTVIHPLIKRLFGVEPWTRVSEKGNTIQKSITSKQAVEFLVSNFHLTIGKKKNKMHIPHQIKEHPEFAKAFIRGLFDTDGGFFRHHQTLGQLQLCSLSPGFLQEVSELLTMLGFKNYISGKNLYMCHSAMIDKFFAEIKPANDRLTRKYEIYQQTGVVPLQREISKQPAKILIQNAIIAP